MEEREMATGRRAPLDVDAETVESVSQLSKALSDPARLCILSLLFHKECAMN